MSKERIAYDKRFALWQAHAGRCAYCGQPVRFLDMQIDHVLPEWLKSDPKQLGRIQKEYGLDDTFNLCDYCNWLPAHSACNRQKGAHVPDRNFALFYISLAKGKLAQARTEEERYIRTRAADQVVGKLLAAVEKGALTKEDVLTSLATVPEPVRTTFDPIVVCFGLSVDEVLQSSALPADVPTNYPALCDWLEADLLERAQRLFGSRCFYPEASTRNGETLSVRLALVELDLAALSSTGWDWWEILEVEYYSTLYGPAGANEEC
jgi:hypothetical protein